MSMSTTKRSAPGGDGETGKTSRSGLLGGKGEWAGRGEELLREQLRNVQEECRQLRQAYRQGDSGGMLRRTLSSQSLPQSASLSVQPHPSIDVSSHLHTSLSHTPRVATSSSSSPLPPSHSTHLNPSLSVSNVSLSSTKSTRSELGLSSTSYRPTLTGHAPRYMARQVSSTPRTEQGKAPLREKGNRAQHGRSAGVSYGSGTRTLSGIGSRREVGRGAGSHQPPAAASTGSRWQSGRASLSSLPSSTHHHGDSGYNSGSGLKSSSSHLSPLEGRATAPASSASPVAGSVSHLEPKQTTTVPAPLPTSLSTSSHTLSGSFSTSSPHTLTSSLPNSSHTLTNSLSTSSPHTLTSSLPTSAHTLKLSVPATVSGVFLTSREDRGRGGREDGGRGGREEGTGGEMEQAHARIRQLEREVAVLEQQLAEKTQSARGHVEELTCMRSELARERAVLARERQENKEAAGLELRKERASHAEQCQQLVAQVETLRKEKREGDREIGTLRASLKACQSEVSHLTESVARLSHQLREEGEAHIQTKKALHVSAEEGRTRVARLEHSLKACQEEVTGQISQVEKAAREHLAEVEQLRSKVTSLSSSLSITTSQLQDRATTISKLEDELARARVQLKQERETKERAEEEFRHCQQQSEQTRQSLLLQVERGGRELERMTSQLSQLQQREQELERGRAEVDQLKRMVSELQQSRDEVERERREGREERQHLQVELGLLRAQLESTSSQLQQAQDREQEYTQTRAELVRETEQMRVESQKVRGRLDACQRELGEARKRLKEKESEVESSVATMRQELATRAQKVLEMDQLLRTHRTESTSRRLDLERNLVQHQSDLKMRTQQLEETSFKLSESQRMVEQLGKQVSQLQSTEQTFSSENKKQLLAKDTDIAQLREHLKQSERVGVARDRELERMRKEVEGYVERVRVLEGREKDLQGQVERVQKEGDKMKESHVNQLQALQETHSSLLASSEQQAASHRKTVQQLSEQQQVRQEELSRCRAQVASLSLELAAERKMTESLGQQLTLTRAEAARYQAQVSSMQRSLSLSSMAALGVATRPPASSQLSLTSGSQAPPTFTSSTLPVSMATAQATYQTPSEMTTGAKVEFTGAPPPPVSRSVPGTQSGGGTGSSDPGSHKRGQVIDL